MLCRTDRNMKKTLTTFACRGFCCLLLPKDNENTGVRAGQKPAWLLQQKGNKENKSMAIIRQMMTSAAGILLLSGAPMAAGNNNEALNDLYGRNMDGGLNILPLIWAGVACVQVLMVEVHQ